MKQETRMQILKFPQEPICNTCKQKIEFFPFRHIRISGPGNVSQTAFYHYFFPCYDLNYIMMDDAMSVLEAGFTFDSEDLPGAKIARNLTKNLDLWISDGY